MAFNILFKSDEKLKGYKYALKKLNVLVVAPEIFECIMDKDTYHQTISQLKYIEVYNHPIPIFSNVLSLEDNQTEFLEAKELLKKYNKNL